MKYLLLSVLCLFVAVTFVACGGGGTSDSEVSELAAESTDSEILIRPAGEQIKFEVDSINVSAGQEVTLVLENIATLPTMMHNVVILTSDSDEDANRVGIQAIMAGEAKGFLPEDEAILAATPMAQPGETVQVTFTAPLEPGKYRFICTYPGHYVAMRGVLVVSLGKQRTGTDKELNRFIVQTNDLLGESKEMNEHIYDEWQETIDILSYVHFEAPRAKRKLSYLKRALKKHITRYGEIRQECNAIARKIKETSWSSLSGDVKEQGSFAQRSYESANNCAKNTQIYVSGNQQLLRKIDQVESL